MNLIQELLGLNPKQVTEARREEGDLADLVEKFCDKNKLYHFEGGRGVNNFEKIIAVFDYRDVDNFLEDNPGCIQAMIEWIGEQKIAEWKEAMAAEVPSDEDEELAD